MLWEVGRVGSGVGLYSRISSVACYNSVLLCAVTFGTGRLTQICTSKPVTGYAHLTAFILVDQRSRVYPVRLFSFYLPRKPNSTEPIILSYRLPTTPERTGTQNPLQLSDAQHSPSQQPPHLPHHGSQRAGSGSTERPQQWRCTPARTTHPRGSCSSGPSGSCPR